MKAKKCWLNLKQFLKYGMIKPQNRILDNILVIIALGTQNDFLFVLQNKQT